MEDGAGEEEQVSERYDCDHCGGVFPVYLEHGKRRDGLMGIYVAGEPRLLCPEHLAAWHELLDRQDDERRAFVKGGSG